MSIRRLSHSYTLCSIVLFSLIAISSSAYAKTVSVGPGKSFAAPCAAFATSSDGDIVEIDAAGRYVGDVCGIYPNNLTIRGVNGRPKIDAGGQNSMGKGIWVLKGNGTVIENVEMFGAKVIDQNGAAIRLDGRDLTLRGSYLHNNENGILTNNDGVSNLVIENSEFSANGFGTGYTHNLYVGHINSLIFRGNYSHDANVGHNLKSRAETNTIIANRFSSTEGGQPSYEIDLPNAGTAYVVGNVIHQPAANQNPGMLTFGVEGVSNIKQDLFVVNNTFINDDSSRGTFVFVGGGVTTPVLLQNNIFAGTGTTVTQANAIDKSNIRTLSPSFVDRATFDLHPSANSPAIGNGTAPDAIASGFSLTPTLQYLHPASTETRPVAVALDIGAYAAATVAPTTPIPNPTPTAPVTTSPFSVTPVPAPGAITVLPAPNPGVTPTVPTSFLGFQWNACGVENATCKVPGLSLVRYGANGQYNYQIAMTDSLCSNNNFGDPIVGIVKSCDYISYATPAPTPSAGWVNCATENGICNFTGTATVRYGVPGSYTTKSASNTISCNNATFGDPAYGIVKNCDYQLTTPTPFSTQTLASSSSPTLTTAPTPIPAVWTECATENGICSFTGTHLVRYGAQGRYATLNGTASIACNNATFGDPVPGYLKTCAYQN